MPPHGAGPDYKVVILEVQFEMHAIGNLMQAIGNYFELHYYNYHL